MAKEIKKIGVLTSGGDSPGMNAAIRAVAREAMFNKCKVIGIKRGYKGLLNEEFFEMKSVDVAGIIQQGGTILGTARCPEFKEEEVQEKAADICNAVMDVAPAEIIRVVGAGNIEIIDYATAPSRPDAKKSRFTDIYHITN